MVKKTFKMYETLKKIVYLLKSRTALFIEHNK